MAGALLAASFVLFLLATAGLLLRSLSLLYLLRASRRGPRPPPALPSPPSLLPPGDLPLQLVQLPFRDEDPAMLRGLIDSACALDYPRDRLWIQVLDDSRGPAVSREVAAHVEGKRLLHPGLHLAYLHREDHAGFKAGNLNHGLARFRADLSGIIDPAHALVSIFDADFLIPKDYLQATAPFFADPGVCAVQVSLRYINADENLLTRVQASFMENLHRIDFAARSRAGHLSTFRGSAGSWRLSVLASLGGWSGDTQIEDVDMSMAAQLAGHRIVYLDRPHAVCRLPATCGGFLLQQRSWMKGMMEVMRKHLGGILRSRSIGPSRKAMALELFLVLSLQPLYMIGHHLLALPAWFFLARHGVEAWMGPGAALLAILLNLTHLPFLRAPLAPGQEDGPFPPPTLRGPGELIASFLLSLGMFPAYAVGLVEGLAGAKVHRDTTHGWSGGRRVLLRIALAEWALAFYAVIFAVWAAARGEWGLLVLYGPFALAYPLVGWHSLRELSKR